jgi:hypothetical protein
VAKERKTEQLQIRVSQKQKHAIRERARRAGMKMSDWVLTQVLPPPQTKFHELVSEISSSEEPGYPYAELLEFVDSLTKSQFQQAVADAPGVELSPYWTNYLAATVEHAASMKRVEAPSWTGDVPPLAEPVFGSDLESLRLYLLTQSPPAFSRRNIFITSNVGDRI